MYDVYVMTIQSYNTVSHAKTISKDRSDIMLA